MRLSNRVAIVTGGASGIGLATAKKLAAEGSRIVVADLNEEKAQNAAAAIARDSSRDAIGVGCDVSVEEDVERVVAAAIGKWGAWDIVVNNAGVMIFKPLQEQTLQDWNKVLGVDLLGAFLFTKQAFIKMQRGGSIINIASIHAVETTPLVSAYAAAKAALLSFTRSSSLEGAASKIRVNAILPGAIDTPMLWENPNVKSGLETIDRGMVGKAEDIANVVAFLASDEADFIRGASVIVDGGRLGRL